MHTQNVTGRNLKEWFDTVEKLSCSFSSQELHEMIRTPGAETKTMRL